MSPKIKRSLPVSSVKCSACTALSNDVHVLEAEGGPAPDRAIIAIRLRICNSCYSRPDKSQMISQLCTEIFMPPSYWSGRAITWSSSIRMVRSPYGQRSRHFWHEPEALPLPLGSTAVALLTNGQHGVGFIKAEYERLVTYSSAARLQHPTAHASRTVGSQALKAALRGYLS